MADGYGWTAPLPRCPVHGQMKHFPGTVLSWYCAGFDGEGCDYVVTGDDINWQPLGENEGARLC
jgi:hypothetical protein